MSIKSSVERQIAIRLARRKLKQLEGELAKEVQEISTEIETMIQEDANWLTIELHWHESECDQKILAARIERQKADIESYDSKLAEQSMSGAKQLLAESVNMQDAIDNAAGDVDPNASDDATNE